MFYIPKLGMQGNIEESLKRNQQVSANLFDEVNDRKQVDTKNREIIEQTRTDVYLNDVETQQTITDIQLQILEG